MSMKAVRITCLPPTWWHQFSEALCNSRGYQTEWQIWRASSQRDAQLMRDLESTVVRNLAFARNLSAQPYDPRFAP